MPNIATTRILHVPEYTGTPSQHGPWVWPLPRLDGVAPCVLASIDESPRDSIDIGYVGRSSSPGFVPVFAAHDGVITYAVPPTAAPQSASIMPAAGRHNTPISNTCSR